MFKIEKKELVGRLDINVAMSLNKSGKIRDKANKFISFYWSLNKSCFELGMTRHREKMRNLKNIITRKKTHIKDILIKSRKIDSLVHIFNKFWCQN
jgi:hypothetical protein